jgi:ATP-binding cassette subfamily B protein
VFLAYKNVITLGEVVLFQSLFSSINGNVSALINLYPTIVSGREAVHSLSEIICVEELERDEGKRKVGRVKGKIDFDNVSYHYPHETKNVIKDFDLHVEKGERIALVGASGSGKSTVVNLVIGLLSPTSGRIRVDGKPLDELPLQEYRRYISVVPQNSILFSGTIRENIMYGNLSATEEEMIAAAKKANIHEFITTLASGYDSEVGERGVKLSGGQKQRISIARALLNDAPILILDDSLSAVDTKTERALLQNLKQERAGKTTILIAHRISTIEQMDKIIYVEDGRIVAVGAHEQLLASCPAYATMAQLQKLEAEKN